MSTPSKQPNFLRSARRLVFFTMIMFGFGYALVPLYDLFCDITGLGGKTGVTSVEQVEAIIPDKTRTIKVEFASTTTVGLPWEFRSLQPSVEVHPGEVTEITYFAKNKSATAVVGQAIPSVTPNVAAKFFNKTECFCFTQQTLEGNEEKIMPVRFIIDPAIPKDVRVITLGYSFFNAGKYAVNDDS